MIMLSQGCRALHGRRPSSFQRTELPGPDQAGRCARGRSLTAVASGRWVYAAAVLLSVYLSIHSHLAEVRNFSSFGLRLAAYCFASIIALMSYSHWALDWRPTFPAVACTLLSLSSPALWRVHSRTLAQERLRELGLIDGHAVRLGAARFALHPVKSFRVLRIAVWSGEQ